MANLSLEQRQLCDIQGRLFELALKNGYDCPEFIQTFMNSRTAAALDDTYDRLQWAGEEYIPLLALLYRREQQGHFPNCRSRDHERLLAGVSYF